MYARHVEGGGDRDLARDLYSDILHLVRLWTTYLLPGFL